MLGVASVGFAVTVELFPSSITEGFPKLVVPNIPEDFPKIEGAAPSLAIPEDLPKENEVLVDANGEFPNIPGLNEPLWLLNVGKAEPVNGLDDSSFLLGGPPNKPPKLFVEGVDRVCDAVALLKDLDSRPDLSSPSETNRESPFGEAGVNWGAAGLSAGLLIRPISLACRTL